MSIHLRLDVYNKGHNKNIRKVVRYCTKLVGQRRTMSINLNVSYFMTHLTRFIRLFIFSICLARVVVD